MKTPDPTRAELEILSVLWRRGPLSVREIWTALGARGSYTTSLKLLQVMLEKRLVTRDTSNLSHVYSAAVARETSRKQMVGALIERAFEGSVGELILSALEARPASAAEMKAIRDLLDGTKQEAQRKRRKRK